MFNPIDLNEVILKFSADLVRIPYLIRKENDIRLIDNKHDEIINNVNDLINNNNEFKRRRRVVENTFINDYVNLIERKNKNKNLDKYTYKSSGRHITALLNKIKEVLKTSSMEPVFISEPNTPMKRKNNYENTFAGSPRNEIINEYSSMSHNEYPNEYNYIINNNLGYPFRTKIKLESLNIPFETSPNYNKNIMKNKLKYSLRTYSIYKHSFIGDIFFESDKAAFLLLINVNTRYAYAYQLGKVDTKEIINIDNDNKEYIYKYATNGRKTTKEIIKAFDEHLLNHPINILRFDGEKAINSNKFKQHFKDKFKIIPAISEAHSCSFIIIIN